jgi:hypothetical protein
MRNHIFGHFRDVITEFDYHSRDNPHVRELKNCDFHEYQ